jgi:uncharacterized integral membrane protein
MADSDGAVRERSTADWLRNGAAVVVAGLLIAFAVLNSDSVEVHWIFGTWSTPLVVVIVLCLALGALLDRLVLRRRARR